MSSQYGRGGGGAPARSVRSSRRIGTGKRVGSARGGCQGSRVKVRDGRWSHFAAPPTNPHPGPLELFCAGRRPHTGR